MNLDPFSNPFRAGLDASLDLFARRRPSGAGPRKPVAAAPVEEEPEAGPGTADEEKQEAKDKVLLRNPKWEIEKVGFNEETDISVEAELPESEAHKTKVAFELFARTPDGEESISRADGNIDAGKAKARIPVYIPQYKDEEGNLLRAVDYYFSAKHSASDLLKDETVVKRVDEMAERLLESHILADVTFATGKSQVRPAQAPKLKALTEHIAKWKEKHPDGKLAVFGHADAVGREEPNKQLSERRARSIHAFLVKDPAAWDALAKEEKWDMKAIPDFRAFMDGHNALSLADKDFEAIDGKPHAGCSEFNQAEAKAGEHEPNRRVSVFLLKSGKNFPIQYPCKHGDIGPCRKQVARKGDRRTPGFGCLFYDKLVTEAKGEPGARGTVRFVGITEAEIKQYVNLEPEEGKPEQGMERKIEVEVAEGLGEGDEVFWTVTAGAKNSPRTEPKRGPKLLPENGPAEFQEGVARLVSTVAGGKSHILLACGVGGGDGFTVEAGGSRDKADCKVKVVTWRRLEYETFHPKAEGEDRLTDWTVFTPDKGPGLPDKSTQYLDKVLGQAYVEFKEIGKDTFEGKDLPAAGRYNVLDGAYVGKKKGTKVIVSTTNQLGEIISTRAKHASNTRAVSMIWCDFLTIPKTLNQSFAQIVKEDIRSTESEVFEYVIGTSSLASNGQYSISLLAWKATHWYDDTAPEGDEWRPISAPGDPGFAFRNGGEFTDETDIKAHLRFDGIHSLEFRFPATNPGYPGKLIGRDANGCFADKGKVIGLTIDINGVAGNTRFNGMALQGKIWMNTFAGRVQPVGMAGVIAHELGHNMGQAYADKNADDYFGRPSDKPMPGIPFPKPVPDGDVYGKHGHQGTHCAKGISDKAEDDFTAEGSKAFGEHTCIMFGASDMEDSKEFTFCEDCLSYIRAENLSDIKRSWRV